jgi:hypothetical protein
MVIKTKRMISMKIGIWDNLDKMREMLDKLSLFYLISLIIMVLVELSNKEWLSAVVFGLILMPSALAQWSKMKYNKITKEIEKDE